MYKILFICPLFLFLIPSCKNSIERVSHYPNGQIKESYIMGKDSIKNGPFKKFMEDGTLFEEAIYKSNKLDGERRIYFSSGTVEIVENYKNDVIDGPYQVYRENGDLLLEYNYVDGQIEGLSKKFYKGGNILEEVNFSNGLENGPFKEYYESGGVQWEGQFLNGPNEFGELKQYDETGELIKKMICDSLAICHTIWTLEEGDITPKELKIGNKDE